MPAGFMHQCEHPGCTALTVHRYCDVHMAQHQAAAQERYKQTMSIYDKNRPAYHKLYDSRWQRYRRVYLASHPFCVECKKAGIVTEATVVDHIVDHKGDLKLFWDASNHQALCSSCHSKKTLSTTNKNTHA